MLNRKEIIDKIREINKDKSTIKDVIYIYNLIKKAKISKTINLNFNFSYISDTEYIQSLIKIKYLLGSKDYINASHDIYDFFYFYVYNKDNCMQEHIIENLKYAIKEGLSNEVQLD